MEGPKEKVQKVPSRKDYQSFCMLEMPQFTKKATYNLSYSFNIFMAETHVSEWNKYDRIGDPKDKLILGQQPPIRFMNIFNGKNYIGPNNDTYKPVFPAGSGSAGQPKALVVSCVDWFEVAGSGAAEAVISPSDWTKIGVKHQLLLFTDFTGGTVKALMKDTLNAMLEAHKAGIPIYVHCKAGRARSGIVVALFLCLINKKLSLDVKNLQELHQDVNISPVILEKHVTDILNGAIKIMQHDRIQVAISGKKDFGIEILSELVNNNEITFEEKSNSVHSLKDNVPTKEFGKNTDYLNSTNFIRAITQDPSFKALTVYALQVGGNRFKCIQTINEHLYKNPLETIKSIQYAKFAIENNIEIKESDGKIIYAAYNFCQANPIGEKWMGTSKVEKANRLKMLTSLYDKAESLIEDNVEIELKQDTSFTK